MKYILSLVLVFIPSLVFASSEGKFFCSTDALVSIGTERGAAEQAKPDKVTEYQKPSFSISVSKEGIVFGDTFPLFPFKGFQATFPIEKGTNLDAILGRVKIYYPQWDLMALFYPIKGEYYILRAIKGADFRVDQTVVLHATCNEI